MFRYYEMYYENKDLWSFNIRLKDEQQKEY